MPLPFPNSGVNGSTADPVPRRTLIALNSTHSLPECYIARAAAHASSAPKSSPLCERSVRGCQHAPVMRRPRKLVLTRTGAGTAPVPRLVEFCARLRTPRGVLTGDGRAASCSSKSKDKIRDECVRKPMSQAPRAFTYRTDRGTSP